MEEKKIQFEGISDEETWKLFSWFEKLINQSETKKVIRLLDFLNKKSNVSWNTIYDLSFFMQRKNDESSEQTETWNNQNENRDFLLKRINELYDWKLDKLMTDIYLKDLLKLKNANLKETIEETLKNNYAEYWYSNIILNNIYSNSWYSYDGLFTDVYKDKDTQTQTNVKKVGTDQFFMRVDLKSWQWDWDVLLKKVKKEFSNFLKSGYEAKEKNLNLFEEAIEILADEYDKFLKDKNRKFVFLTGGLSYKTRKDENLEDFVKTIFKKAKANIKTDKDFPKLFTKLMSIETFCDKSWLTKQELKIKLFKYILEVFKLYDENIVGDLWKSVQRSNKFNFANILLDENFISDINEKWRRELIDICCDFYSYNIAKAAHKCIYDQSTYTFKERYLKELFKTTFWEELINQPWWEFFKKPIDLVPLVVQKLYRLKTWGGNSLSEDNCYELLKGFFPNTPKDMLRIRKSEEEIKIEKEKKKREEERRKAREEEERIAKEEEKKAKQERMRQEALKEIEEKKEEFERENQKLKKRQEKIKLKLAWDKEYNNFIKKVLSKKVDIANIGVQVHYIPYWEDSTSKKIWKVSSEILNKKTTPLQFATYYKILKVFENMSETLEDFIYSMRRRYEIFQADKKLFEKVFREHLSDVYFLTKEEQDVIIWEMKRMFWDEWAFIDAFYIEFMPDLIGCEFLASQDEACFPASIKEIELVQKYNFNDEEEEDDKEDVDEENEDNDEDDTDEEDNVDDDNEDDWEEEDDWDEDEEFSKSRIETVRDALKEAKVEINRDKGFQNIVQKMLSKEIDSRKKGIQIHYLPYWNDDASNMKTKRISSKLINKDTNPLLFVACLKILKIFQKCWIELEEIFSIMKRRLDKHDSDKYFRKHLSDFYSLTKEEQDALLEYWNFVFTSDFYEDFMEELVGTEYSYSADETWFPSFIEKVELIEGYEPVYL